VAGRGGSSRRRLRFSATASTHADRLRSRVDLRGMRGLVGRDKELDGCTIRVTEASDELRDLIPFVGLDGVLLDDPRREVEEREEAGLNEAVDAGDETV
jgi:hypothetical protein